MIEIRNQIFDCQVDNMVTGSSKHQIDVQEINIRGKYI